MFLSGNKERFDVNKLDSYIFEKGDLVKIYCDNIVVETIVARAKAKCDGYENHPLLRILAENDAIGWSLSKSLQPIEDHFAKNDIDVIDEVEEYYYLENGDVFEHFPQYNTKLGKLL